MSILFQPVCFSSSGSDHFQHSRDQFSVLCNGVCFIRPKLSLFYHPPTLLLQGIRCRNQVSILFIWSFSILFHQCSYLVILRKIFFKFIILCSFSCPVDSIQALSIMSFPRFKCFSMPVYLLIFHLSLFIPEVQKISQEIRVFIPNPFKLFRGCNLIQAI